MKYTDIKDLSVKDLAKKRATIVAELFNAKIKNSIGQLANPIEIRDLRKDLARVHTALTAKAKK